MKKTTKIAVCACALALALAMTVLAGCDLFSSQEGVIGEVSDSEWQKVLSINVEDFSNATIETKFYNTYGKDEAEEYGEWSSSETKIYFDREKEIVKTTDHDEKYLPEEKTFKVTESTTYEFAYQGKYYRVTEDAVTPITKAEFIHSIDAATLYTSMLSKYSNPAMKSQFQYNSETKVYEYTVGPSVYMGIQFLDNNGVRLIEGVTTVERMEEILHGFNSTKVSVSSETIERVKNYLREQAEGGEEAGR